MSLCLYYVNSVEDIFSTVLTLCFRSQKLREVAKCWQSQVIRIRFLRRIKAPTRCCGSARRNGTVTALPRWLPRVLSRQLRLKTTPHSIIIIPANTRRERWRRSFFQLTRSREQFRLGTTHLLSMPPCLSTVFFIFRTKTGPKKRRFKPSFFPFFESG